MTCHIEEARAFALANVTSFAFQGPRTGHVSVYATLACSRASSSGSPCRWSNDPQDPPRSYHASHFGRPRMGLHMSSGSPPSRDQKTSQKLNKMKYKTQFIYLVSFCCTCHPKIYFCIVHFGLNIPLGHQNSLSTHSSPRGGQPREIVY